MNNRTTPRHHDERSQDVGTLWTMTRKSLTARCALLALTEGWEVRVVVGNDAMLSHQCAGSEEAFSVAEEWRLRLSEQAWQQIVPARQHLPVDGLR